MNRYVSVRFQRKDDHEKFGSLEYTYIDGVGLMLDDLVVAPTAKGDRIAKVSRVGVSESEIDSRILPILKIITSLHETEMEGADFNG